MIRGDVKVILYDENGKEVETRECHNLVTRASYEQLTMAAGHNVTASNLMPIAQKALGGLLFLGGTLTESADNINLPSDARIVGCASQDIDTSSQYRGSLNDRETEKTATGFVTTWDFSTSQMNTTINALALTSADCGKDPFYFNIIALYNITQLNPASSSNPIEYANNIWPIKYDRTTQELYFIRRTGGSKEAGWNHVISKVRIPMYSYRVADDPTGIVDGYEDVGVSFLLPTHLTHYGNVDVKGVQVESNTVRKVYYKYDTNSSYGEVDNKLVFSLNIDTLTRNQDDDFTMPVNTIRFCVSGGYLYYISDNDYSHVHAKEIGGVGTRDYNVEVNYYYKLFPDPSGLVYCDHFNMGSEYLPSYALYPDSNPGNIKTYASNRHSDDREFLIQDLLAFSLNANNNILTISIFNNYLGTIFNLPEPVTKLPTRTMKVIYTLTDVTSS